MPTARTTRFRGSIGACAASNHDLLEFVRLLAQLRRLHAEFRRETFLKGAASRAGVKDVTWLNVRGTEMTQSEWQDANLRTLGIWFGEHSRRGGTSAVAGERGGFGADICAAGCAGGWPLDLLVRHRAREPGGEAALGTAQSYALKAHSVALLEC